MVSKERIKIFDRTRGVSSNELRSKSMDSVTQIHNQKLMLTPGPAVVLYDNIKYLKPIFGRGDGEYDSMATDVVEWIKKISGQDQVVFSQGSATFALELAAHTFVSGKIGLFASFMISPNSSNH